MSLYDEVYGLKYKSAREQMRLMLESMRQRMGQGFADLGELEEWAHDHRLDKVMFSNMTHNFMCVSHKGEIMSPSAFEDYYGNILFYDERSGNRVSRRKWHPDGFEYYDRAYIAGEQTDGVHRPLYYRDYCVPSGYYSEERDAFNVAKPFPVFAMETGRDTGHIYTYIEHIAGECAYHLLAWLRAKLLYPTVKTQVVPVIVSRSQGTGKTTFAEVICKGLFGKDNVLVTDQYDSMARFNADYADALIVCQEEKEEADRRNPAGALKSRATATTIRKELKGIDPIYQDSYTDFIMTTNKDVPIKFDGREDQRRFMIMESDPLFTRKTSDLADEVFTKLYGYDGSYSRKGVPFAEDRELIAQFKHELFSRADIAAVDLRKFPKTEAYSRCFTLPRTTEATEIESIMRALAPVVKASLEGGSLVREAGGNSLEDIVRVEGAVQYMPAYGGRPAYVALCRPLVFYEIQSGKPFAHSVVERGLYDCRPWLTEQFGLDIIPDMDPLPGGFRGVQGRYGSAPAAKVALVSELAERPYSGQVARVRWRPAETSLPERRGRRLRVNAYFRPDNNGCFETVNELPLGTRTLKHKTDSVLYLDTFLLESDEPSLPERLQEERRAEEIRARLGDGATVGAGELYKERLERAVAESCRLFDEGVVCRIVYSGAKSYHLLIRVEDAPATLDEYKWLHAHLCQTVTDRLEFDPSTSDPARLTRSPLRLPRETKAYGLTVTGEQRPVREDWGHVYRVSWRPLYEQWKARPLRKCEERLGRPLYPTKKEYLDAADALVTGVFWTDGKFDGDRQRLFFPAYRLLRASGYSHDEAWDGVLLPGIESYKKPDERGYWRTRRGCELIEKIDGDFDITEEGDDGGDGADEE